MTGPSGSDSEITFISGVTASGTVAGTSFATYKGSSVPPVYNSTSTAFKWGNSTIGTGGGTITYCFDTSSNWTSAEQNAFESGLALWQAECNVTFQLTTDETHANVVFTRNLGSNAANTSPDTAATDGTIGGTADGTPQQETIRIDTGDTGGGFGPIGDTFDADGGYPFDTLVHEEGHALGLGHGGPYNAGDNAGNSDTRQFGIYDSRLWSIMSYNDPTDTSATYYNQYSVTGTSWTGSEDPTTGLYWQNAPTTPMMLDILAIQRIYGAPTSGPLTTGQTFGFNCTIPGSDTDGSLHRYFDFSNNLDPIVTIWDSGTGNTLDLSGWSTNSVINLNPGTFSSCDSNVNNLCIAEGTRVDTGIGGAGADQISANGDGDLLEGNGGADALYGGTGNDTLIGGAGADYLVGDGGLDTFKDTAADLNGDTIADLANGDKIVVTDAVLSGFSFTFTGTALQIQPTSGAGIETIGLQGSPSGAFTAQADPTAGVDLIFTGTDRWLAGTASWTTPSDWSLGTPGYGSIVAIGQGHPTIQGNVGTVWLLSTTSGGELEFDASAALATRGDVGNGGTILLAGPDQINEGPSFTVGGNFNNTGLLSLDGVNSYGQSTLSVSGALTNGGTVQVGNATSNFASQDVLTAGALSNAGTIALVSNGTGYDDAVLTVNGNGVNSGTVSLSRGASLATGGNLVNSGSILLDQSSTIGGSSLSVGGTLFNTNLVTIGQSVNASYGDTATLGGLGNAASGTIDLYGEGVLDPGLTVNGAVANDGSIVATNIRIDISGAVTGAGTITLNSNVALNLGGSDTDNIAFNGGNDTLKLAAPSGLSGTLSGLTAGDVIDLVDTVATSAVFNASRTQVTIAQSNGQTLTYKLSDVPASSGILLESDGEGGTDLAIVPDFHWAQAVSGDWSTSSDWTPDGTPAAGDTAEIDATGATYTVTSSADNEVAALSLVALATLAIGSGTSFTIDGSLVNAGTIALGAAGQQTSLVLDTGTPLLLKGAGRITLSDDAGNEILGNTYGTVLDNVNNTISGAGTIDGSNLDLGLANEASGTIDADATNSLALASLGTVRNNGILEATGTGGLQLGGLKLTGTGTIRAVGAGAHVDLDGTTVTGGVLTSSNGGVIDVGEGQSILDGSSTAVRNSGAIQIGKGGSLLLDGAIVNAGALSVATGGYLGLTALTLTGGGRIVLSDSTNSFLLGASGLDNVNDTIAGSGQIRVTGLNGAAGVINATGASGLSVSRTTLTNAGLLEDTGTGGLQLGGATITGSGRGTLQAVGAGAHVDLDGASIVGGTLKTAGGGVIQTAAGTSTLDGRVSAVVNAGTLAVSNNSTLFINGTLTNTGTVALDGTGSPTSLYLGQAGAVLRGGGQITMSGSGDTIGVQYIPQFSSQVLSLDNVNNTISGGGGIQYIDFTNEAAGVVDATQGIGFDDVDVANKGVLEATGSGQIGLVESTVAGPGTIKAVGAGASIELEETTLDGGTLLTTGGAAVDVDGYLDLDGSTGAGAVRLNLTQSLDAYVEGSIVFANDAGIVYTPVRQVQPYVVSAGQSVLKSGGTGVSTLDMAGQALNSNGLIEALTGTLEVSDTTISGGGTIEAGRSGSLVDLKGVTVQGEILATANGGGLRIDGNGGLDGSTGAGAVTNRGNLTVEDGTVALLGTIDNTGLITLAQDGSQSSGLAVESSQTTLTGGGHITLTGEAIEATAYGDVLTTDQTISGTGIIGLGHLSLANSGTIALSSGIIFLNHIVDSTGATRLPASSNSGMIEASSGGTVTIQAGPYQGQNDIPVSSFTNSGTMEALSGGQLLVYGNVVLTNNNGTTLTGGTWIASGSGSTLYLPVRVTNDSATIILSGAGSVIEAPDSNGNTAPLETTLSEIGAGGTLEVLGGRNYATSNAIQLDAASQTAAGGVLRLGGGTFSAGSISGGSNSAIVGYGTIASSVGDFGNVTVTSGKQLSFTRACTLSGALAGAGTLDFTGQASDEWDDGTRISAARTVIAGATLQFEGDVTDSGSFAMSSGTLLLVGSRAFTFTVGGAASLTGGAVTQAGTLALNGASTAEGVTVTAGATLSVGGSLDVIGVLKLGSTEDGVASAGKLLVRAGATLDLSDGGSIAIAAGTSDTFTSNGTVEKVDGTGVSRVLAALTNARTILAESGTLAFARGVVGTGTDTIANGGTLQFDGTVGPGQTVSFGAGGGELVLDAGPSFAGAIKGFGSGDTLDVGHFGTGTTLAYAENGAGTGGALTLTDGGGTAHLAFTGHYAAGNFSLDTASKPGDALITYRA